MLYWNLGLLHYKFFLLVIFTINLLLCEESVQKHVYLMWWQLCCYSIILKLLFSLQKGSSSYCGYKYAVILIPKVHIPLRALYLLISYVHYVKILKGHMSNSKTWRHWHNGSWMAPLLWVPNLNTRRAILTRVFKNVIELNLFADNCNKNVMLKWFSSVVCKLPSLLYFLPPLKYQACQDSDSC